MDHPEFSITVLIVNYFTYRETLAYVNNLKKQRSIRLSVLIVDNCSPNESFSILFEAFKNDSIVEVIQSKKNGGYAYGNNFGLHHLKSKPIDYVMISNNDIELRHPYLLNKMVNAYRKLENVGFVAPRMYTGAIENIKHQAYKIPEFKDSVLASLRTFYWIAQKLHWTNSYSFDKNDTQNHPVDCVSGAFFLGTKNIFFEIGLFDENTFLYCEEAILSKRIKAIGKQNYQIRSLSIHHFNGQTTQSLNTQYQLQREWLKSTIYYHQQYDNLSFLGILLLKFLYSMWAVETWLFNLRNKLVK